MNSTGPTKRFIVAPVKLLLMICLLWVVYVLISRLRLSYFQFEIDDILLMQLTLLVPLSALIAFLLVKLRLVSFEDHRFYRYQLRDDYIWLSIIMIAIVFICDIAINGVPALADTPEQLNNQRLSVRIPFLYSFSFALAKVLAVYLLLENGSRNRVLPIATICGIIVAQGMLTVSRGAVISFFIPIAICIFLKIRNRIKWPLGIVAFIMMLELFSAAGKFREGGAFSIIEYGGFGKDVYEPLAWLWGYVFVNIDNLALIASSIHDFEFKTIFNFSPTFWMFTGREITADADLPYITKFNLSTGYGYLVYDFGLWGAVIFTASLLYIYSYVHTRAKRSLNWLVCNVFMIYGMVMFPITNLFIISSSLMIILAIFMVSKFVCTANESN